MGRFESCSESPVTAGLSVLICLTFDVNSEKCCTFVSYSAVLYASGISLRIKTTDI